MANKKTIKQLEDELDVYFRKLRHVIRQIEIRRELVRKIRLGKVKQPEPAGKKISLMTPRVVADFDDDVSDIASGYGVGLGEGG